MKKIAVFFGGKSVEHDISLITGVMTANSIDKERYSVIPVLVDTDGAWYTGNELLDLDGYKNLNYKKLKRVCIVSGDNVLYELRGKRLKKIDSIFMAINCMHGENGEDGSLIGSLKMSNIATCSPDLLASSISIDKAFTKTVMKGLGVKVVKGKTVDSVENALAVLEKFKFPLIVKPNLLGSSIGVSKVNTKEELIDGVNLALKYGKKALIEECVKDLVEINCGAYFDGKEVVVSECERPVLIGEFLSFSDKYKKGKRVFPADIDKELSDKIKSITKKVYESLNFNGVIRIDYFISNGEVYLNEINSVPGSLAYYLFSDTLKGFTAMLNELIDAGQKEFLQKNSYVNEYKSGILLGFGAKSTKRL